MAHEADNAWKDILHLHFPEFLEFFFPEIHRDVEWRRPIEALDKELEPLIPECLKGKSLADKLVKLCLKSGREALVFIHVEVQGYVDQEFEERMLRYNTRIRERYGSSVVSLAVLTDSAPGFYPTTYEYAAWGFRLRMEFPVVKLLRYRGRERELEESENVFSVVVLAHLASIRHSTEAWKYRAKWRLVKHLYARRYPKEAVQDLVRFLDWILRLPPELERGIIDRVQTLDRSQSMPYLSNIERWAMAKGHKEGQEEGRKEGREEGLKTGLLEAIVLGLECRFGERGLGALPRLREIQDLEELRRVVAEVKTAKSLEEFLAALGTKT